MGGGDPEPATGLGTSMGTGAVAVIADDRLRSPMDAMALQALVALAERTLLAEGVTTGELSLSFVEPDEIEALHVRFMDEQGPTDVLSFPLGEDGLIGDVIVCPAVAAENDPQDTPAELRLLVVHGVLHILGYDHQEPEDRAVMWARQERYAGVAGP